MVSAPVCHTGDVVSITIICSNASMAEGIMHQTLNLAIKVRVLVGVLEKAEKEFEENYNK